MSITVKESKVYRASDNTPFDTRDQAVAHEKSIQRVKNLTALNLSADPAFFTPDGFATDCRVISAEALPNFIARNGDAILAALDIKQARGRKKGSKVAKPETTGTAAAA